jgi:hypothetical protein
MDGEVVCRSIDRIEVMHVFRLSYLPLKVVNASLVHLNEHYFVLLEQIERGELASSGEVSVGRRP